MLLALASLWSIAPQVDLAGDASASAASSAALHAPAALAGDASGASASSGALYAPAPLAGQAAASTASSGELLARASLAGDASAFSAASSTDLGQMRVLIRCGGVFLTPAGRVIPAFGGAAMHIGAVQSVDLGPVSITPTGAVILNG